MNIAKALAALSKPIKPLGKVTDDVLPVADKPVEMIEPKGTLKKVDDGLDLSEAATFDPAKKDSSKLLASATPFAMATAIGYSVFKSEEAEAIPISKAGKVIIQAYHGTPHQVERFSTDRIGTGEGAQAYGHGLYFADRKGVSEDYRKTLSGKHGRIKYKGDEIRKGGLVGDDKEALNYALSDVQAAMEHTDDVRRFVDSSIDQYKFAISNWKAENKLGIPGPNGKILYEDILFELERLDVDDISRSKGNLYEVEINVSPDEFLDWDKPLSDQPSEVKRGVISAFKIKGFEDSQIKSLVDRNITGEQINYYLGSMSNGGSGEYLKTQGIKGIQYYDGASRHKPIKDIIREFRKELPDDADFDEVMDLVDEGHFSPEREEVLRALSDDDWLGFDYPSQAISAAYKNLSDFDPSPRLEKAIKDTTPTNRTRNYVVFDDADITIMKENDIPRVPQGQLRKVN